MSLELGSIQYIPARLETWPKYTQISFSICSPLVWLTLHRIYNMYCETWWWQFNAILFFFLLKDGYSSRRETEPKHCGKT